MASTFYSQVQRLLALLGERLYDDTTQFNSSTLSDHQKVQLQAKEWFSLNHTMAMAVPRARFLLRDFTFNTADGDNSYNLDATTNYERLLEDSMFITGPAGSEYGPLQQVDLWEYRTSFPANDETTSRPTRYYHLLRTDAEGPDAIAFTPPPDDTYNIQYSAFIKPYKLTNATDEICCDTEWEHVFMFGAMMFVEIMKSEGKGADFAGFADTLKTEFEQHTIPLAGEHIRLDPTGGWGGISVWGRRGSADSWDY